ncbi:putative tubulin polyglutamylase TTLL6 [Apostichopus japonicus]|uniref:Putative tubulin polyglutamylase TTLL6 n=1 Tax=Stichopus japonicus TaxID=307972 RepID=A0A2G8K1I4_STIJA|nr:putative tubulin polyglutamylase TTLL6 [Apostichopus japonicus]
MRISGPASILFSALLLGVLVTLWNIYELSLLQRQHMDFHKDEFSMSDTVQRKSTSHSDSPVFWINGKNINKGYLDHVFDIFKKVGYIQGDKDSSWDVLWSHEYPFTQLQSVIRSMEPHQKVNHFPGTGYITNKVFLATSDIKFIPKAFSLPAQKIKFLEEANQNPEKLWVQKSSSHRGIRVKPVKELDLNQQDTFVQEYIRNPYLIDGRKFDIGIYATLTSVNPLRVYILHDDLLVRFCPKDYNPIDFKDVDKYVVGDDYTPVWEMPSLKKYYTEHSMSFKETLNSYFKSQGEDPNIIQRQIYEAIAGVFLSKHSNLIKSMEKMTNKRSFFELMRCDFVLDEDLNLYLMEVNMSPNLSSAHFDGNKHLYEQVIYNTLSVAGVARNVPFSLKGRQSHMNDFQVSDREVAVRMEECSSQACQVCGEEKCKLCLKCMTEEEKYMLKEAFLEHHNRRSTRRVYPEPMTQEEARTFNNDDDSSLGRNDGLMRAWFRAKCLADASWCQ